MRTIFVFSSNTQGRHGKGLALKARLYHKAIYGQARGLQGDSYAIVTKDLTKPRHLQSRSVPLNTIKEEVLIFLKFAHDNKVDENGKELIYNIGPIGCGHAGYTPEEIAPMFKHAGPNVRLPQLFLDVLRSGCI